jgi:hypothetical protein
VGSQQRQATGSRRQERESVLRYEVGAGTAFNFQLVIWFSPRGWVLVYEYEGRQDPPPPDKPMCICASSPKKVYARAVFCFAGTGTSGPAVARGTDPVKGCVWSQSWSV